MLTEGTGNSARTPRHPFKLRRFSLLLLFCFLAIVIATGAFSLNSFKPSQASGVGNLNLDQLNRTTLDDMKIVHSHGAALPFQANSLHANGLQPSVTPRATGITLPYNNIGTVLNKGTTTATANVNFDGANSGYSQNALIQSGLYSGTSWFGNSSDYQEIVFNGTTFDWPNVAYGAPDNVAARGQLITLPATAGASSLGFIGSATNGPAGGTAIITYTDSSTQTFSLKFDDWTLGGGSAKVSSFDTIATAMTYRDHQGGISQNIKTYLFYAGVNLSTNKTVRSVRLPNNSLLHIFSVGFRLSSFFNPYSNTGISDDANTRAGNFDGGGTSYSAQELSRYVLPGDVISYNGTQLYWPDVLGGSADNSTPATPVQYSFNPNISAGKTQIGFIGSATSGPSCGTITLTFTDNSTSHSTLCFSDWTLGGGKQYPANGNTYFLSLPDRNTANGTKQNINTYLFYDQIAIPSGKPPLASVTLPFSTDHGQIHIFALGIGSGAYNTNVGSTIDSYIHTFGNFDGGHYSYSSNAMQKAGVVPVQLSTSQPGIVNYLNRLTFNGVTFYWDQNFSVFPDNLVVQGQVLPLDNPPPNEDGGTIPVNPIANPTHLAFLGSATGGSSSGNITIVYSDGSTQTVKLSFSDWCASTPSFNNSVALSMPYRNSGTGSQTISNHLYYAEVALTVPAGATPLKVIMPTTTGGQMHIFSMGFR